MSLSSDFLANCCKHTATECTKNNKGPLISKKKAHEAAKSNMAITPNLTLATVIAETATAPKDGFKVSS